MPYRRVHRGGGLRISRFCTAQASLFEYLQKETVRGLAVDQSRVDDKAKGKAGTRAKQNLRVVDAVTAVSAARWEASIRKVDCQIIRTDYRNREGSTLIRKFQNHSNILQEIPSDNELREGFHEAFVSLVREEPASDRLQLSIANTTGFSMGRPVIGRILIGTERVRLEASSAMHHQSLKAQFEKLAGSAPCVVHQRSRRTVGCDAQTVSNLRGSRRGC